VTVAEAGRAGSARRFGRPGRPEWPARVELAGRFALLDRRSTPVALLGFLARGGIALILLPSAVLPSVLGIAGMTGLRAFTITGAPTWWLVEVVIVAIVAAVVWLLMAALVGSLTDAWLVAMALRPTPPGQQVRLPLPNRRLLLRLAGIRMLCLAPVGAVLAWAVSRLYDATYTELTAPSDLASPMVLRVVLAAGDAVAVVAAVWFVSETVAAVAVRRQMLLGRGIWRSLAEAVRQLIRRPASTLFTMAATHVGGAVAVLASMAVTAAAFDWCRSAARAGEPIAVRLGIGDLAVTRDFRPLAFGVASVALVLAWAAALAVSGAASAWRNAAMTYEVGDAIFGDGQGV
jgi:hypothetical protein